jgi:hypothetical protein
MMSFGGIKVNLTVIILSLVVLILLIIAGIYIYRQGKKKTTIQALPGELPGNPGSGNVNGASNDEIKSIANDIYEDIDGFNVFGHDNKPYDSAVLLNDTDIVKLYNTYNTLYQAKLGETLTQSLENEKFWENTNPDNLIKRLKKLNCP